MFALIIFDFINWFHKFYQCKQSSFSGREGRNANICNMSLPFRASYQHKYHSYFEQTCFAFGTKYEAMERMEVNKKQWKLKHVYFFWKREMCYTVIFSLCINAWKVNGSALPRINLQIFVANFRLVFFSWM